MSFSAAPNSRVSIKLKPRAPVRASVGADQQIQSSSNATTNSHPFGAAALRQSQNILAASEGHAIAGGAIAGSAAVSVAPSHSPEEMAKSTPFWAAAIGMLDIVLDPTRLALVLKKEERAHSLTPAEAALLTDGKYAYSCEEVCTAVRCICDLGASEALYKELHSRLSTYISNGVKQLVASTTAATSAAAANDTATTAASTSQTAIEAVVTLWSGVIRNVVEISTVFMYLDRRYVLQETREGSIFNVGVALFKTEIIFRGRVVTRKANEGYLKLLEEDRQREKALILSATAKSSTDAVPSPSDTAAAASIAQQLTRYRDMTLACQLYFSELEPLIIEHSQKTFTDLGNELLMGADDDGEADDADADGASGKAKDESDNATTAATTASAKATSSTGAAVAYASGSSESDDDDDNGGMASAREFFAGAERLIQAEHRRITKYLDPRSRSRLDEALQLRLVKPLVPTLFESDFAKLVAHDRLEDIARGFQLMCLRHVNEKEKAKKTFSAFVKKWASLFVNNIGKEDDDVFVPNIIALDDACSTIIAACFSPGYDEEFNAAKISAFEAALQNKEQRISQLLVKFMDGFLRTPSSVASAVAAGVASPTVHSHSNVGCRTKPTAVIIGEKKKGHRNNAAAASSDAASSNKKATTFYAPASPVVATPLTADAVAANFGSFPSVLPDSKHHHHQHRDPTVTHQEEDDPIVFLDKALRIFVYMPSKDLFEAFYLREFANRVLTRRSASTETERHVIAKLRGLCGSQLTKQLEGMLKDLDTSLVQTDAFRKTIRDRESGKMDEYGQPVATADDENANSADGGQQQGAKGGRKVEKEGTASASAASPTAGSPKEEKEKKLLPPLPAAGTVERSLLMNTTVSTLTQSFWPFFDTFVASPTFFPSQCRAVMTQFEAFYASQFRQRNLTWVHSLAQCTVRAVYGANVQTQHKDLHGSFVQGLILSVCFPQVVSTKASAETQITFAEILRRVCKVEDESAENPAPVAASVGVRTSPSGVILSKVQLAEASAAIKGSKLTAEQFIIREMIVCALLGLLTPKLPILLRGPVTANNTLEPLVSHDILAADIKDDDVFRVNTAFTNKQRSIRVPQILPKDNAAKLRAGGGADGSGANGGAMGAFGGANDDALLKKIESQRQYLLDATIARIMKAKNSCQHADLVAEVLQSVSHRFTTDGSAVKVRIEELLKRSFIERDTKDAALYHFRA